MEIKKIEIDKKQFLDLLLLADVYLTRGRDVVFNHET